MSSAAQYVHIFMCKPDFSQSTYNRSKPSHACTLISIHLAHEIHQRRVRITNKKFARDITCLLADAIEQGNKCHDEAMKLRMNHEHDFTIPDGIVACRRLVEELDFVFERRSFASAFEKHLLSAIKAWQSRLESLCLDSRLNESYNMYNDGHRMHTVRAFPYNLCMRPFFLFLNPAWSRRIHKDDRRLYMITIALQRASLIVFDPEDESLLCIDTHSHEKQHSGALVFFSSLDHVNQFVNCMKDLIYPECKNSGDHSFELSIIEPSTIDGSESMIFGRRTHQPLLAGKIFINDQNNNNNNDY